MLYRFIYLFIKHGSIEHDSFKIKISNLTIDGYLTCTITTDQSGPGSNEEQSTLLRSLELVPHNEMHFIVIPGTPLFFRWRMFTLFAQGTISVILFEPTDSRNVEEVKSMKSNRAPVLHHPIYPTPPLGQDMTQGQFLSGV